MTTYWVMYHLPSASASLRWRQFTILAAANLTAISLMANGFVVYMIKR